ncbi:MAG TPA: N-acetylmuramoyl-L-alanine amidase, partial [Mycobacteriales bacterium]|nr:N-acetylmuramoyl-L-alanine amidase [Mycobacteriales bacterium]
MLRSIYAYHSRTRGWGDIGYNFIVDRFGRIWEGRYGGVDSAVIGAHTGGFNYQTFGAAMLGTYSTAAVPAVVVNSLAVLFAWKLAAHYQDPNGITQLTSAGGGTSRYPKGVVVSKRVISGHRDVGATDCPGNRGYATLAVIRAKVTTIMGTGLLNPTVTPTVVGYPANASPRLTATLWRLSFWTVTVTGDCPAVVLRRYTGNSNRIDLRWSPTDQAGRPLRPGSFRITVTASAARRQAVPFGAALTLQSSGSAPAAPTGTQPAAGPAGYVPIAPVRVLDTRTGLGGGPGLPLTPGGRVDVPVLGVGGIPASGVAAVALSGGGICSTAGNWLLAWPAGTPPPVGAARPAGTFPVPGPTVVGVGADGRISVAVLRPMADVVLEAVGYLPLTAAGPGPAGAAYHPVPPRRIYDTAWGGARPLTIRYIDVRGFSLGAVPAAATGVSLTLHVGPGGSGGVLRLFPHDQAPPAAATLRYQAGWTQSVHVVAGLPANGLIGIRYDGPATPRYFLDLDGWFGPAGGEPGQEFTMVPRRRVANLRIGPGATGALPVTGVAGLPTPPAGTAGVMLQVTGLASTHTYLTVFGAGRRPPVQHIDLLAGDWGSNLVFAPIRPDGRVSVFNGYGTAQVVVDVLGYLAPAAG